MQMPQICGSISVYRVMWWRQAEASNSSSRGMPARQSTSRPQPAGQASTQARAGAAAALGDGLAHGEVEVGEHGRQAHGGAELGRHEERGLADPAEPGRGGRRLVREEAVALGPGRGDRGRLVTVVAQQIGERGGRGVEGGVEAQVLVAVVLGGAVRMPRSTRGVDAHEDRQRTGEGGRQGKPRVVGGDAPCLDAPRAQERADGVPIEIVEHRVAATFRMRDGRNAPPMLAPVRVRCAMDPRHDVRRRG